MDNGTCLEMIGFHPKGYLGKVERHRCRNRHNGCRMVGQLWHNVIFFALNGPVHNNNNNNNNNTTPTCKAP